MDLRYRQIQRVLLTALGLNILLACGKLLLGLQLHSLAVISDAVHSFLDGAGGVVGLLALQVAAQPAEGNQPDGHRKFEILATFVLSGLLLLSCWEILGSAVEQLRHPRVVPFFSWGAVLFLVGTLGVNLGLATYESQLSRKLNSPLLAVDFIHARWDFFTTLLALSGLLTARIGWYWLDAVAAVGVVLIIGRAACRLILQSVETVSEAERLDPEQVRLCVESVRGAHKAHAIRSHGRPGDIHLELHIRVNSSWKVRELLDIENRITEAVKNKFPGVAHVVVRHEPLDLAVEEDEEPGGRQGRLL